MQCDRLMLMVGLSFLTLSRWLTTDLRRFMIIPMLCVTIFVILVVWFLLPRGARLMIHTPTAISIFVCLSMVQLMAVFISMRCTFGGHFLQVAFSRSGWLWPVDAKGEPLKATSYMAVGFYVAKYVNKKSDMDLAAKGLG